MGNELYHFGVKGMKWGVRRYRNKDRTSSKSKKRRYEENYNEQKPKKSTAKKLATGAAIAGAAALTAYGLKNKNVRDFVLDKSSKSISKVREIATSQKVKDFVSDKSSRMVKSFGESVNRTGKAMTDAALVSIGTIQISKLTKKLETNENDSEEVRNRNKVILDTATAGIKSITKANSSGSGNNSKSNSNKSVGKDITDSLGSPSKKGIDKSSTDYQNLFKDNNGNQRDSDIRSTIKSLASAGYDIDQIKQYLNDVDSGRIKHSSEDINFIVSACIGKDFIMSIL